MAQQRKQSITWSDKLQATNDDISRIQIKTGQLVTNPKSSAVGQITVWYGSLPSQPHGSSKGIMNIQDHNFTLNRGEQIKSIKVFTSYESQFIIGLQFKTTTNRDSIIFGQNSRFNYEIKSPYSSRYFVEYLHGTANNILVSLQAQFTSNLKSPFVSRGHGGYSSHTMSSSGSAGSAAMSEDESYYASTHSNRTRPMMVNDLDNTLNSSQFQPMGSQEFDHSFTSSIRSQQSSSSMLSALSATHASHATHASSHQSQISDRPMNVEDLQHGERRLYKKPAVRPVQSHYVGVKNSSTRPNYSSVNQQNSLALNRPIYQIRRSNSYKHSHV
jgi:hypothetical protein